MPLTVYPRAVGRHRLVDTGRHTGRHRVAARPSLVVRAWSTLQAAFAGRGVVWGLR